MNTVTVHRSDASYMHIFATALLLRVHHRCGANSSGSSSEGQHVYQALLYM